MNPYTFDYEDSVKLLTTPSPLITSIDLSKYPLFNYKQGTPAWIFHVDAINDYIDDIGYSLAFHCCCLDYVSDDVKVFLRMKHGF